MGNNALLLRGTISSATITDGTLIVDVDLGQDLLARFAVPIVNENHELERLGQNLLSRISRKANIFKLDDSDQLVSRCISVKVIQPTVEPGMLQPLVVVGIGG